MLNMWIVVIDVTRPEDDWTVLKEIVYVGDMLSVLDWTKNEGKKFLPYAGAPYRWKIYSTMLKNGVVCKKNLAYFN